MENNGVGRFFHHFSTAYFPGGTINYLVSSNVSSYRGKNPLDAY
jgi:hypothetical protein